MKKFQVVLYFASIVVAVVIGLGQVRGAGNYFARGAGAEECIWTGYGSRNCATSPDTTGCSTGTHKYAKYVADKDGNPTAGHDFKTVTNLLGQPKTSARGNCSGTSDCKTPKSTDMTSTGCGG